MKVPEKYIEALDELDEFYNIVFISSVPVEIKLIIIIITSENLNGKTMFVILIHQNHLQQQK